MKRSKIAFVLLFALWLTVTAMLAAGGASDCLPLLFWGVVGMLVGWLCGQRRGDDYRGASLGLVLGPIGWLLCLCGPDLREKCRECGGVIAEGAHRCMHCGSIVRMSEEDLRERYGVQVKCPACGELGFVREVGDGTRIECPVCKRTFEGAKAIV